MRRNTPARLAGVLATNSPGDAARSAFIEAGTDEAACTPTVKTGTWAAAAAFATDAGVGPCPPVRRPRPSEMTMTAPSATLAFDSSRKATVTAAGTLAPAPVQGVADRTVEMERRSLDG